MRLFVVLMRHCVCLLMGYGIWVDWGSGEWFGCDAVGQWLELGGLNPLGLGVGAVYALSLCARWHNLETSNDLPPRFVLG